MADFIVQHCLSDTEKEKRRFCLRLRLCRLRRSLLLREGPDRFREAGLR